MASASTTTAPTPYPQPLTFFLLPRELQLTIIESLSMDDYVTFTLAAYSHLRISFPDYFPAITRSRLRAMRSPPPTGSDPLQQMPNEMILHIAGFIERRYLLRWVFAHYWTLGRCNPPLVRGIGGADGRQMFITWIRVDGSR